MRLTENALSGLTAALGHKADAIQSKHRRLLRQQGLDPQLASLSPAALVHSGASAAEFLELARLAGRRLALHDIPLGRLITALHLFRSLVETDVAQASAPLEAAVQAAATEAYLEVSSSETQTLAQVLQVETAASTEPAMLEGVLEPIRQHLGAIEGRLYQLADDGGVTLAPPALTSPAQRKRLSAFRVFRSPDTSGVIKDHWSANVRTVWSVPLAASPDSLAVAQFGFAEPRTATDRERRFLAIIGDRCSLALERIARERGMRERSLKLISVEEMERSRLSRELHDEPAQSLAVVRLHIEIIEGSLPEQARAQLAEVRSVLEKTILDVRRLISDLSPPVLEQLGVAAAIRQLVVRFRRSYKARVSLQLGKLPDIDQQYGLVLYRSLQECFSNISKHSRAKNINVSLTATDRVLRLQVEDDGVGFLVKETMSHARSFGLIGIRERVSLLGGRVSVLSTPIGGEKKDRKRGKGTKIEIELPLPEKNPS